MGLQIDGNLGIPPQFDQASGFSEGVAAVKPDGRYGYIDKTGELAVVEPQYTCGRSLFKWFKSCMSIVPIKHGSEKPGKTSGQQNIMIHAIMSR